jgi:hypothetical protein
MKKTFTLEQAGLDFTQMVDKLYRKKKRYKQEGSHLAWILLETSVDIGAKISCLGKLMVDEDKRQTAREALAGVVKVENLLTLMESRKFYRRRKTKDLHEFCAQITSSLTTLLSTLAAKQDKKNRKSIVVNLPAQTYIPTPIQTQVPESDGENAPDDDGFGDLYESI